MYLRRELKREREKRSSGKETTIKVRARKRTKLRKSEREREYKGQSRQGKKIRNAMRMRAAWVYLQLPFPVTPTRPTDSPVFLVARPSSTARFSHRAVSREESFRAFSLRVFCFFLVRRVVRKS